MLLLVSMNWNIPISIQTIAEKLESKGFEAFIVGGCVRDMLLGKTPKDWDITTNANPQEIQAIFPESFYDNNFGTVSVKQETSDTTLAIVQITPYRTEGKYTNHRRPESVIFGQNIEEDLLRRDFTINAMALRVTTRELLDFYKGQNDVQKKVVRAVGNPDERFTEDALRMLRAIRFSAELGFIIAQETTESIQKHSKLLEHISKERIRDEFTKIVLSPDPEYGLIMCAQLGILPYIAKELTEGIGVEQNQAHAYDVWTHLIKSLKHAADKQWPLDIRLAALFHDIAKPRTRRQGFGKHNWTFYGHEVVGEKMTRQILSNLKFPKNIVDKVSILVRWHMFFSDTEQVTPAAVRRLIVNVGKENIWDLMNLRICDRVGTGRPKEDPYRLRKYHAMIEEVLRDPISVSMLAIDGKHIMQKTKTPAGPRIGWILHALLEEVLDTPEHNTVAYLEEKALELSTFSDEDLKKLSDAGKEKQGDLEEKEIGNIRKKHFVR